LWKYALQRWADEDGSRRNHISAVVLSGLGDVLREQGDLAEAERCLQEGIERGRIAYAIVRAYISLASLQGARGDFQAFRRSLDAGMAQMSRFEVGVSAQLALAACAVQWHLAQGDVATAAAWVEQRLPHVDPAMAWLYEQEQIIRARLLLAQGHVPEAGAALSRQAATARAGGRIGNWLAATVLELLAADAAGSRAKATDLLIDALAAAESEGYVRIFLDEGPAMVRLLEINPHRYASRLLGSGGPPPARNAAQSMVEALTDREREVLGLIAGGLTNPEIGSRLYISEATVKRHVYNIYGKLGVTHRTQALVRARELGLL
jgi:LuxR family maltose regulon positive regulatory protein